MNTDPAVNPLPDGDADAWQPPPPPPHLLAARDALIADIHTAFHGVTRDGGVSWTETSILDNYGSRAECAAARASDRDRQWTDLLNDPAFDLEAGHGGFCFLDPVGCRYHLPAAMIKILLDPYYLGLFFVSQFSLYDPDKPEDIEHAHARRSLLSAPQADCVRRFMELMVELDHHTPHHQAAWRNAILLWDRLDPNSR